MAAILDFGSERFLALFRFANHPDYFLPSFKSIDLSVQVKKRNTDFQGGSNVGHLGFPIGTILAIFDLLVTLMLPTKFQVN